MQKQFLLAALAAILALVFAGAASAADETSYPSTLVEQTCTDAFDAPANITGAIGGGWSVPPQTSGSGDDFCDHDSRILTDAALVADTVFGPFEGGLAACYIIFADGNTVSGGDAGWAIAVHATQPHDGVKEVLDLATEVTGVTDEVWSVGLPTQYSYSALSEELNVRLPTRWYLVLTLLGATSWLGEISMVRC